MVITLPLRVLYGYQNKQQTFPYTTLTDWILKPKWRVFTVRYALNPYVTQTRFVFKGYANTFCIKVIRHSFPITSIVMCFVRWKSPFLALRIFGYATQPASYTALTACV